MRPISAALLGIAVASSGAAFGAGRPSRPPLRALAIAAARPEFFSLSSQGPPGFERALLEAYARSRGRRIKIVPVAHFDDAIPALLRGDGEILTGILDTPERRQRMGLTVEVLPSRSVVVTRAPQPRIDRREQLPIQRVGVVRGSVWEAAAAEAGVPTSRIVPFFEYPDVIHALRSRRVTATVMTTWDFLVARREDPALQAGIVVRPPQSSVWAVRPQDVELRADLDVFIGKARQDGLRDRLAVSAFGPRALQVLRELRASPPAGLHTLDKSKNLGAH